jgi:hypothetical protein
MSMHKSAYKDNCNNRNYVNIDNQVGGGLNLFGWLKRTKKANIKSTPEPSHHIQTSTNKALNNMLKSRTRKSLGRKISNTFHSMFTRNSKSTKKSLLNHSTTNTTNITNNTNRLTNKLTNQEYVLINNKPVTLINVLTYNLCWGCMKADDTSERNSTAKTLALRCKDVSHNGTNSCLGNIALHIDDAATQLSTSVNKTWDFVGTQESAKWDELFRSSRQLAKMGYVHHLTNNGIVHLTTFYNPVTWQLDAVKCGDLAYKDKRGNIELGRPYHILFLTSKLNGQKLIVINVHNGHFGGIKRLITRLSEALNTAVSFKNNSHQEVIREQNLEPQSETDIYESVIKGNKWDVIMMGDFNDHDAFKYYKGIIPFKNSKIRELNNIKVSSHGNKPPPTCCKPNGGDKVLRQGINNNPYPEKNGDYILISEDLQYIIPSQIPAENEHIIYDSYTQPASDHLPAMAVIGY